MECFQKGPKAPVGRMPCQWAPSGAAPIPQLSWASWGLSAPHVMGDHNLWDCGPPTLGQLPSFPPTSVWKIGRLVGSSALLIKSYHHPPQLLKLQIPKSSIRLRYLNACKGPSRAWLGELTGYFLTLLELCCGILLPAPVPGHPLTSSHMQTGLWTNSPVGYSLNHLC